MMLRSSLLRTLLPLGLSAVTLAAWAWPDTASACSCQPWLEVAWPSDGATVSANDRLVIRSECGASMDDLSVLVDGQPASLVVDPDRLAGAGIQIVPEPAPGSQVVIEGCPGFQSCEEAIEATGQEEPWGMVSLTLTVGERDETAPAAPELLDLDYLLEPEVWGGGCSDFDAEPRPARDWTLELLGRTADEDVLYHVTLGPTDGDVSQRTTIAAGSEELEITMRRFQEDAGQEVCATVRTFDMAGNEAETVQTCRELAKRETLDGQGCACTAGGGSRGLPGAALLLLVGAWARRRRS